MRDVEIGPYFQDKRELYVKHLPATTYWKRLQLSHHLSHKGRHIRYEASAMFFILFFGPAQQMQFTFADPQR
jgi:hypothetical protein